VLQSQRWGSAQLWLAAAALSLVTVSPTSGCSAGGDPAGSSPAAERTVSASGKHLSARGVSVRLYRGWDGRSSARRVGGRAAPLVFLQFANFDAGRLRQKQLRSRGVVVTISELSQYEYDDESAGRGAELSGPLAIRRADLLNPGSPQVPRGQALAKRYFTTHGRAFALEGAFGTRRPQRASVRRVNRVLRTFKAEAR
jgi:hypothetical protein